MRKLAFKGSNEDVNIVRRKVAIDRLLVCYWYQV